MDKVYGHSEGGGQGNAGYDSDGRLAVPLFCADGEGLLQTPPKFAPNLCLEEAPDEHNSSGSDEVAQQLTALKEIDECRVQAKARLRKEQRH